MGTREIDVRHDVADEYTERVNDVVAPVAVAIVAAEPLRIQRHPTREFTAGAVPVNTSATAVQIVGPNPFRDRLVIRVPGDQIVYIGPERDTLTPMGGYPLTAGQELTLSTRHAVYAVAAPTNNATALVHFLAEHVDG